MVIKQHLLHITYQNNHLLYCPSCLSEFSSNYNDYFMLADTDEITCGRCGSEMHIVSKNITYKLLQESGDDNDGTQRENSNRSRT